jgi:hypothetical protein
VSPLRKIAAGFRFGALVAAGVFAFLSTTASASDSLVRVLATAPPNLPESIAIDLQPSLAGDRLLPQMDV